MRKTNERTEWGQPVGPLTTDETEALERLGMRADWDTGDKIVTVAGGGYVGSARVSPAYFRWLIRHQIRPELAEPADYRCSVGQMPEGGWMGWSHRAARICTSREEAVAFSDKVS